MRSAPVLLLLLLAATPALAAVPAPSLGCATLAHGADCAPIRPGARTTAPHGCTLNFVYTDAQGRLYTGTAGHCTDALGQRVSVRGAPDMGEVVYRRDAGDAGDFALILVDDEDLALVSPSVCGLGGPTALAEVPVAVGSQLHLQGQGSLVGETPATRGREGVLTSWQPNIWKGVLPALGGDSGAPVLLETGEAVGHLTHLSGGILISPSRPPTDWFVTFAGTRTTRAIALAEEATGLELSLVTAPLLSPEERARELAVGLVVC